MNRVRGSDRPDLRRVTAWLARHKILQPIVDTIAAQMRTDYQDGADVPRELVDLMRSLIRPDTIDHDHQREPGETIDQGVVVTVTQAADVTGLSAIHVRRLARAGRIQARHAGPRDPWLVTLGSLQDYLRGTHGEDARDDYERQRAAGQP